MIMNEKIIAKYSTGSYLVTLYSDGTKTRKQINDYNIVNVPESIDMKITKPRGVNVEAGVMAEKPGIALRTADAKK
jgi:hypothetical protein